jgi:DNA-binding MarR family transcriptional regulator
MGAGKTKSDLLPGTLEMLVLKMRPANNRRARFYKLTPDGRKHLAEESARYRQVTGAVARIMGFG